VLSELNLRSILHEMCSGYGSGWVYVLLCLVSCRRRQNRFPFSSPPLYNREQKNEKAATHAFCCICSPTESSWREVGFFVCCQGCASHVSIRLFKEGNLQTGPRISKDRRYMITPSVCDPFLLLPRKRAYPAHTSENSNHAWVNPWTSYWRRTSDKFPASTVWVSAAAGKSKQTGLAY
jgi:hypothetical protein